MTRAVISVGSNLGDRVQNLSFALNQIENLLATDILATSAIYQTAAIGGPEQDDFLNAVLLIETEMDAHQLLEQLQSIETACGRTREIKWGPRTLDLDIIDFENLVSSSEVLQIPHPRAVSRRFVVEPLFEIAPDWQLAGQPLSRLLEELSNQKVEKWVG